MLNAPRLAGRRSSPVAVLVFLVLSALVVPFGQPASAAHSTVIAVKGFAYGYELKASLFGTLEDQTRGYGQVACTSTNPPTPPGCAPNPEQSSTPSVELPTLGGSVSQTDPDGSAGTIGPAIVFSSGETTVSSQGTRGTSGSVTTTTDTKNINRSRTEQFTAARAVSSCTHSLSGVSRSTTITNGTLEIDSGWDFSNNGDYTDEPGDHPPHVVSVPTSPAANHEISGHIHIDDPRFYEPETWKWTFNKQVANLDGSSTVYVGHQEIYGPTLVGDLWVGRADCGVTTEQAVSHDPPVASDDAYSTNEDTALTVAAPGVLGNDVDPNGDVMTAALATAPANGTATVNSDGSFTYTPNLNYNGSDSFTYTASDGNSGSDTATVNITVNAVNDPPDAVNDAYSTNEDTALTVVAPGVLGNDTDAEGDVMTAALATAPANGTATVNANGSFTYTPNLNFNGTDTFTYTASNAAGSDTATVTMTVNPVNDAPDAINNAYSTNVNTALTVPAPGVLGNDVDVDGNSLTATMATGPTRGTVALSANGGFTYTPNTNVVGTDSFTYTASDGAGGSDTATVTITVHGADIRVGVTDSPDPVVVSQNVTYTITVTNDGPVTAQGVALSNTTVTNGSIVSVTTSNGTCSVVNKVISCNLGNNMAAGTSRSVTVVAKAPNKVGTMSLTANASSSVADHNTGNNKATQSTTVVR